MSFVTSFGTFFLGRILLASTHAGASLSQPGVLRSLVVSALYVEVCGLFAFGLGALVRNTAAALTLAFGFLVLLSELIRTLPVFLHNDIFDKLGLAPDDNDNRRVIPALRYLES